MTRNDERRNADPTAWIVLGMHRSGTSLLTRSLSGLNAYLGPPEELLGPAPDNPEGFFEPREMMLINEALLGRPGTGWVDPPRNRRAGWRGASIGGLRRRAKTFLAAFKGHPIILFKDPRLCLTLPFWAPLLPRMRVVLALRRPSAIIRSLERRNGLTPGYSRWLWAHYTQAALDHAGPALAGAVFYEDLMTDPMAALAPLSGPLDLGATLALPATSQRLRGFTRADLDHAPVAAGDRLDRAYEALRRKKPPMGELTAALRRLAAPLLADPPARLSPEQARLALLLPEAVQLRQANEQLRQANEQLRQANDRLQGELEPSLRAHRRLLAQDLRRLLRALTPNRRG